MIHIQSKWSKKVEWQCKTSFMDIIVLGIRLLQREKEVIPGLLWRHMKQHWLYQTKFCRGKAKDQKILALLTLQHGSPSLPWRCPQKVVLKIVLKAAARRVWDDAGFCMISSRLKSDPPWTCRESMRSLGQDRAEGFGRYTQADGSCYEGSPADGRGGRDGWVNELPTIKIANVG